MNTHELGSIFFLNNKLDNKSVWIPENSSSLSSRNGQTADDNPVGRLLEQSQVRHWPPPIYKMDKAAEPSNEFQFTVSCHMFGHTQFGRGSSMKKAKFEAAYEMLQLFRLNGSQMGSSCQSKVAKGETESTSPSLASYQKHERIPTSSSKPKQLVTNKFVKYLPFRNSIKCLLYLLPYKNIV